MQVPIALDDNNGGELFWMCTSADMTTYTIEMTKLEVNCNLVTLQPGSFQLFSENDLIMRYEVEQSSINSPSFIIFLERCGCRSELE